MSKHNRRTRAQEAHWDSSDVSTGDTEGAGHRHARLEHILTNEIEMLIRDEVSDPALSDIHVASVTLSPDGAHARIGFVIEAAIAEEGYRRHRTEAALARAGGFIRARLAAHLNLKRTPKLTFTYVGMVEPGVGTNKSNGGES